MILQELQIEGFRSLKSVTWKPGRLNVLIGPNGGGKSNLLAALDLIRISAGGNLRKTVLAQGGMTQLAWNGTSRIAFTVKTESYNYDFELDRVGNLGSYVLSDERLTASGSVSISPLPPRDGSETMLSDFRGLDSDPAVLLRKTIKDWSIHHHIRTDPRAELRGASVTRFEERLDPDGQNLIPVLHTLYESNLEFEELIDDTMRTAFSDYEKLRFPAAANGRTQLQLRRKSGRLDSASDLSDGTLRFLLLLAALGSPDPAPLIAIDEPETGLHPRMLPIIAAVAANTAMKTQVIFTTHSPMLLDGFGEALPTTTVVTWNGTETEMKTIGGEELKRWVENYSLGKFVFSGEAEAVL